MNLQTQSYLDGELHGAAAQAAERHLQTCAACQALAAETADLSDLLRKAARHRAPDALRARVSRLLDREAVRRPPRPFWWGAASGAGITALAASLAIMAILPPSAATLTQSVADAHARALVSDKMIMVVSSNHHTVKPWLAAHAGLSPPVTDFAADGFALAGGRVDEVAGMRTAVMVYRHGNHQIDLFAWPDRGAHLPEPGMVHGFRSRFWKSGDLDFAAMSDVDSAAFEKFTALVRAQRE
ncbi:MAG TPA: zf-HC2 domain-containing protein [Rhizomicrobium sp.]|nr:zf-HC2 domain-containing protein [Rhizomicrobium sp.]